MNIKYCTCKKCGKETKVNTNNILLSYPAKYSYKCDNCDTTFEVVSTTYLICEECYSKSE